MENDLYNSLCLSLLNDQNTYESISQDPLNFINLEIKKLLDDLLISKNISKKLHAKVFIEEPKLGSFRILAKLHKEKFGLRPIINCKSHPTSAISLLIDLILQPFVRNSTSFIKDSQHLIQFLDCLFFPLDSVIISADFDSLYTSMRVKDVLIKITNFIQKNFFSNEITTFGFHSLLKIVFNFNYFQFNDKFFKQFDGIGMGSKCAPAIANIYLSILEESFIRIEKPLFYKRFIDDTFSIFDKNFDLNIFKNHFGYLKLNIVNEKVVNFLDLNIKLDPINCSLIFSLFIKPTNTFSYLDYTSNHPLFVFKNIPKGLLIRVRRICTYLHDYFHFARLFCSELNKKGYDEETLNKVIRMISKLKREDILPYKEKNNKLDNCNFLFFQLPFNFNYINLDKFFFNFNNNSYLISNHLEETIFKKVNLRLVYNMNSNLSKIFIHNFKVSKPISFRFHKCTKISCKHCNFSNLNCYVKLNNFYLPIMNNSSCNALNVIYILYCDICLHFYIGQTVNFRKRFNDHKRNILINNTVSDLNDGINLYNHFNLNNHSLKNLKFFIFKTNVNILMDRLNIECQLMHLFLKLNIPILNCETKITDIYHYRNHSYLFT